MTAALLALRLRSTRRLASELMRTEPFIGAVLVTMLAIAQWRLVEWARLAAGQSWVAALSVAPSLAFHLARRDGQFLRIAGVPHRRLFAAEYLLLCLPFSLPLLVSTTPQLAAVGPTGAALVALLPAGLVPRFVGQWAQRRSPLWLPIPATSFEWLAGIRRSAVWLALLHVGAAVLSSHGEALLVVLALVALTPAGFYVDGEGSMLVEAFALPPGAFLRRKISGALMLLACLVAPVALLLAVRHPELWLAELAVLVVAAFVLATAVLVKYAWYREGRRMSAVSPLVVGLVTASAALPPVAALLLHRLWKRSVRTLDPYLHAFDR